MEYKTPRISGLDVDAPPDLQARRKTASRKRLFATTLMGCEAELHSRHGVLAIDDGSIAAGSNVAPALLRQLQQFIDANRRALLDYWEYRIDTDE